MRSRTARLQPALGEVGFAFWPSVALYLRDRTGLSDTAARAVPACYPPVDADRTLGELAPEVDAWERWWQETLEAHARDEGMAGGKPLDALRCASRAWDEVCRRLGDEPLLWVSRVKADTAGWALSVTCGRSRGSIHFPVALTLRRLNCGWCCCP